MSDVYVRLAKRLDELPPGFPPTESGVELKILRKIFSPEEAEMWLKLKPIPETAQAIAERLGMELPQVQSMLDAMMAKGQLASQKMYGNQVYIVVPFVVGIYEFQVNRLDQELSRLVTQYAPALMSSVGGHAPAITRVVPVNTQIQGQHEVHRYEDALQMLERAKSFQVLECLCRKASALQDRPCKHTLEVCLAFSEHESAFDKYPLGKLISKAEALRVIQLAEEEGLVHTTYNVKSGHMYMCNCCTCCCGILRGMKYFNAPFLMAKSNFVAQIDQDECAFCGLCANERCPMGAIIEENSSYRVAPERCIGCGVCTSTCPTAAIALTRRPEAERDEPAPNLLEWYGKRAENRGIKIIV